MKQKRWKKIPDDRVRLWYKYMCGCHHSLGNDNGDETHISVALLEYSGTPVCGSCAEDMKYICTEVKV